ncbi:hypothetical protein [Caloramator sp. Dgby_cultured_2]|uniref:hypothetical protein n=1 Tax=Caloramator sp. Dgby_cultured_2 TaxID=3029174 RepID=UPI00237DF913|nr:hypothetical protein [Caloramator sp. Dgby_cultured_2]WDU84200.1 hypothetical protein PWK10_07735 [Caloramator sp. Dgby_cultured_2]
MPTTQIMNGIIYGTKLITLQQLEIDGSLPSPIPDILRITNTLEIPMQSLIEQGERVIDKADGVGVIGIHEEDDTLLGVDMEIGLNKFDLNLIYNIFGGTLSLDENNKITGLQLPSITEQRNNPKRFQVDVYIPSLQYGQLEGYIRHRFPYCKGILKDIKHPFRNFSGYSLLIKARPHPQTGCIHNIDFVITLP